MTSFGDSARSIEIFGVTLKFTDSGHGHNIMLLLHAAGSDRSEWNRVIQDLSGSFRVIAPDLPGHGDSGKPSINYQLRTLVDFIDEFCRALDLRSLAVVVGHSASGAAAALYAIHNPSKVNRLVLIDAGYGYAIPPVEDPRQLGHTPGTLRLLNPSTREEATALVRLATPGEPSEEAIHSTWASQIRSGWAMQKLIESWTRRDDTFDGLLKDLTTPTLIFWGKEDHITPLHLGERMLREIPNATLVVVSNCGHSVHVEKPSEFLTGLASFMNSTEPKPHDQRSVSNVTEDR